MDDFRLIPFTIESTVQNVTEIPEGVKMIKAPETWDRGRKGAGVVVAVIDSGCDAAHPDLKNRIIGQKNFVTGEGGQEDVTDYSGHGTHVAGTIAAVEDGTGVIGVAPKASLLILKVMRKYVMPNGEMKFGASNEDIVKAIRYCISWKGPNNARVRVINMSLGGPVDDPNMHDAIKEAVQNEILVVCAAGNEGDIFNGGDCGPVKDELGYPGAYNEVVEVGAVGLDRKFPCFTNTNLELDFVAPGVGILSTFPGKNPGERNYAKLSGTSMASPHVAGAAALIINLCEEEFGRTLTEAEVYAQLVKRTIPIGNSKRVEGNGLLVLTADCTGNFDPASQLETKTAVPV